MKQSNLLGATFAVWLATLPAFGQDNGQNNGQPEWCNQHISGVNKEQACQIAIPFSDEKEATSLPIEDSPYYRSLNGIWKFHWVADPKDRPLDFFKPDYDVSQWDNIKVPATWQIEAVRHGKNWDKPLYCNTIYPFCPWNHVEWPNVIQSRPKDYTFASMPDPVGSYRREFTVPDSWDGRDVYIRFNGVEAGFYLWVNGQKVGYSEDSYLPAEFNLTPYLKKGNNVLAVEVYRFTDGSYLECQDFWRFSGIFRDVFLWSAPKTQVRDFFFRSDLDKDYRDASVSLDVELTGKKISGELLVKLTGADGKEVFTQTFPAQIGMNHLGFDVQNPLKWTAETPNLYDLTIQLKRKGQTIDLRSSKVGFREIELANDGRMLINGKEILFKGVDRHDHSAENGRTVSKEEMEKDVQLMKSLNLNAVRTSHYPNNPYFYDLCDQYGLYVLSEANVECHGLTELSKEPSWEKAFAERNENMVRRYRNHASIVIWSLGNESGNGLNHKASEAAIKALDQTRPTHYEGNSDYCDVTSSMYSDVQWLENVGRDRLEKARRGEAVKPHIVCEYAHAMGNAIGNFKEYWETYERYPALAGGFIWDWVDQSIRMPIPGGQGSYKAVGGDFGDKPNDGNFCTNGIIFADRTYSAKAMEVKKILQPVYVSHISGMTFKATNKRFHADLSDLYGRYEIREDGRVILSGDLPCPNLKAQESADFTLSCPDFTPTQGTEYFVRFSFCQKKDTPWAKAGYEVAADQIKLPSTDKPVFSIHPGKLTLTETADGYVVSGEKFRASFSKAEGTLSGYVLNETSLLAQGPKLNVFRAPTDNDKTIDAEWFAKGLNDLKQEAGTWNVTQADDRITLQIKNIWRGRKGFDFTNEMAYTVCPDGTILVNSIIVPAMTGDIIPRIGYRMELPEGFERMRWYGCGPFENYPDRKEAAFVGTYDERVSDQWVDYVKPQVMGVRQDVRWIALTNPDGEGFMYVADGPMAASALHADERDMADPKNIRRLIHPYEVPRRKETILCLDAKHRPLGNASCGPGPMQKYELRAEPTAFSFLMMPLMRSHSTEELSAKARVRMPVCLPVLIERDDNGYLRLSSQTPGADIYYKVGDEKDFQRYTAPVPCIEGGLVTAYASSEHLGSSLRTTVELPIYVDRSAWRVVSFSSQQGGEEARNVIDGDPSTIWHTRWSGDNIPRHPHEIIIDMASLLEVDQFLYTPRNSGNGRIKDYEIWFSQDGKQWTDRTAGQFEDTGSQQIVRLAHPVTARYVKLIALSEMYGREWASAAELNVNVVRNLSGASASRTRAVYADSNADNSLHLATDGDASTCWRTVHDQFYLAPYPHEIQLSAGKLVRIAGLRYTPRQDSPEGRIARYEVYLSRDGKEWGKPVATGTLTASNEVQDIRFTPAEAVYVKFVALSAADGGKMAAIAELEIKTTE